MRIGAKIWGVLAVFAILYLPGTSAGSLSGNYTVGGTGANYASFTDAIKALTANGVSGPVNFAVGAGSFNEAITIPRIKGASATNTIKFSGKGISSGGTRIYYSLSTSGSAVVYLNGTSYIALENLTIENTSKSGAVYAVWPSTLSTYGDTNTIVRNCNIISPVSFGYFAYYNSVHLSNSYGATLLNNRIKGGLYGLYNEGRSLTSTVSYGHSNISGNRFTGAWFDQIFGFSSQYGLRGDVYSANSFDSSAYFTTIGIHLSGENGATIKNNIINGNIACSVPIQVDNPNYSINSDTFWVYNNMMGNFTSYGMDIDVFQYSKINLVVLHNTIDEENNKPSDLIYAALSGCTGVLIENNLLSSSSSAVALAVFTLGTPKGIIIDGNDYYNTGSSFLNVNGITYGSLSDYLKDVPSFGWGASDKNTKPYFISKRDLHLDQSVANPFGVLTVVSTDIDGNKRCGSFPTAGADESKFGTGPLSAKYFLPSKIYPGSPVTIPQSYKSTDPKTYQWFLNGKMISDSVALFTDKFVSGTNTLTLKVSSCYTTDSFSQTFRVDPPTSVPVSGFIADKNRLMTGDVVSFSDLSDNGPTSWYWHISPDSTIVNGVKAPPYVYVYGDQYSQNPKVMFKYSGNYKVCLVAINGLGKGKTSCKDNYIEVTTALNLGTEPETREASGFVFDNGGKDKDYIYDSKVESILIDPCADSIYAVITSFDLYCGYDFLRLYDGFNNKGNLLGNCKTSGFGASKGFTGGKARAGCVYQCMPNVAKPDTFVAGRQLYIEMNCNAAYKSAGFELYWWSKHRTVNTKPASSFVSSGSGDSICLNGIMNFTNTTKIDPADPATFLWDLDGDLSSFECIGACATAMYPYNHQGPIEVSLIATNCGGSDTFARTIYVFDPFAPQANPLADNTSPTTNDIVFFSAPSAACIDHYKWTIGPSLPKSKSLAIFTGGTDNTSASPQVMFPDTGYYDVKLYMDNLNGKQKDSLTLSRYIHVRHPYCIPTVANSIIGIGISKVVFNAISNASSSALIPYTSYVNIPGLSTSVEQGLSYALTVSRNPAQLSEPVSHAVYIDYNGDGNFSDPGDLVASDSNSYSADFKAKIKIPANGKSLATVMRVAVNKGSYGNKPCGKNEYGEYEDYRVYIVPYQTLPIITLKGINGPADTIKIEQGGMFIDPGAFASSVRFGNLTADIKRTSRKLYTSKGVDTLNTWIPGIYIISYNVSDSLGNKAITQYRVVVVGKDKTPPVIIVDGPDTTLVAVTLLPMHSYHIPQVFKCTDNIDGALPVFIDSSSVMTNMVGSYIIYYQATDNSGNTSIVQRVIKVIDSIKPVMNLNGDTLMTLEVNTLFTDPGVNISDNYYPSSTLNGLVLITSNLDTSSTGVYELVYTLADPSGNMALPLHRYVIVVDTIKPVIVGNGPMIDSMEVFDSYEDPGFSVTDNYSPAQQITTHVSGTYFKAFPKGSSAYITGEYSIVYSAIDGAGNTAYATRTIKVQDRTAPTISLKGSEMITICRWAEYKDEGFVVHDNYDSIKNIEIDTEGNFYSAGGTTLQNLLSLRYKAIDKSGNVGYSTYRIIEVKPTDDPSCHSSIALGMPLDRYVNVFPNPSTGIVNIEMNFNSQETVQVTVLDMLGHEMQSVNEGIVTSQKISLDFGTREIGIYYLRIVAGNQVLVRRVELVR